ncbi:MAG: hypothetical protein HRU13_08020, partial [Phycisphaerales bacterium]|nr:hypothetical protein [Phycisphaerales bacterium]
ETFDLSASGARARLTRDVGGVTMDLGTVEAITVNALGGADTVTVNDLPGTARRIIDFVGLPWDDRCLKPHEANRADRTLSVTQVRRPIYTAAKGRAAKYGDLLEPLQSALKRHGVDSKGTEAKG